MCVSSRRVRHHTANAAAPAKRVIEVTGVIEFLGRLDGAGLASVWNRTYQQGLRRLFIRALAEGELPEVWPAGLRNSGRRSRSAPVGRERQPQGADEGSAIHGGRLDAG